MLATILSILKVLLPFSVLSFIQNMAFTASSRSRNSGDPNYHRWCAYMSNGVYYITNALLTVYIIKYGALWQLAVQGVAYTLATAEGSVLMMKKMLAKEKGKKAVGAGQGLAQITTEEWNRVKGQAADAYTIATNMCPDSGLVAMKIGDEVVTNLPKS